MANSTTRNRSLSYLRGYFYLLKLLVYEKNEQQLSGLGLKTRNTFSYRLCTMAKMTFFLTPAATSHPLLMNLLCPW